MIDFRYVEVEYELWALGHMLEVIEPAIKHLAAQDSSAAVEEIRRNGWDLSDDDVKPIAQEVAEKRQYVLPRFMRGPFLVALWACYESGVQIVAAQQQTEVSAPLGLGDLRGHSFLERAQKYFDSVLGTPLDSDERRMQRLKDLYRVRCALAHGNGLRQSMAAAKWEALSAALARNGMQPDALRGMVVPTEKYVRVAYEDVHDSLNALIFQARTGGPGKPPVGEAQPAHRDDGVR